MKQQINVCWLRRDLRIEDNAALYHALKGDLPVLLFFVFDKCILDKLSDSNDARLTFIHQTLTRLSTQLEAHCSSIEIKYGTPAACWVELLTQYTVKTVYTNHDYEPYAMERDDVVAEFLASESINFKSFKDQAIFEKNEILKSDSSPYTVFTPYFRQWSQKLDNQFYIEPYPTTKYLNNLFQVNPLAIPSLESMGFHATTGIFPPTNFETKLDDYEVYRDFPGKDATSRIGIHLRFGTVSIRKAASMAIQHRAYKWLAELAWRDFYFMILWHFPRTVDASFKPAYDNIQWRNNENEFKAWCEGKTGYPLVDAGMRQLNESGYMHNRVRMVTASFLTKHLLIDWRWGEAYFAEKLLDYEMASNIGGWQWACGCGNDAAPYFRIFNPELQARKFDPDSEYINKWLPEYKQNNHVLPIVDHAFARERILRVFKKALAE
jgi:deoxyribodipyrimidine photo-lyase